MNCWGWATWSERWNYFEKDVNKIIKNFDNKDIERFNLDGATNFWSQVIGNKNNTMDTWAIFWYATIFKHNGLCLNPAQTFVVNIGHDGSGVHCGKSKAYDGVLCQKQNIKFKMSLRESRVALEKIQKFYKPKKRIFIVRVLKKILRMLIKKDNFR